MRAFQNGRQSFVLPKKVAFHSFLVPSDDSITIVTTETNLGNILETWGIPFREVNAFFLHN